VSLRQAWDDEASSWIRFAREADILPALRRAEDLASVYWHPSDVTDALRQPRRAFRDTSKRPWPLPDHPWVMGQTWQDLLFAHWRVDEALLREQVPAQIPLDTWDGDAWIGVTPFVVTGCRPRLSLPIPGAARFPEINVRTYATIDGKPGIWFFSLDAASRLAVEAARRVYRIPYFPAKMAARRDGERIRYAHRRTQADAPPAAFTAEYGPTGPVRPAEPGSWEEWACERYCLYTLDDDRRVLRADIHHPPWPLQEAEASIAVNRMGDELGLELSDDPVLHYSRRQDVVFWLPYPCEP
jgi:uncharacterized protein